MYSALQLFYGSWQLQRYSLVLNSAWITAESFEYKFFLLKVTWSLNCTIGPIWQLDALASCIRCKAGMNFCVQYWLGSQICTVLYQILLFFITIHTLQGLRLDIPASVHPRLSKLIRQCWSEDPDARPTFAEIIVELEDMLQHVQVACPTENVVYVEPQPRLHEGHPGHEASKACSDLSIVLSRHRRETVVVQGRRCRRNQSVREGWLTKGEVF